MNSNFLITEREKCLKFKSVFCKQAVILNLIAAQSCPDPESFVRGGPNLTYFLIDEGKEAPNTTLSGSSSALQGNAI